MAGKLESNRKSASDENKFLEDLRSYRTKEVNIWKTCLLEQKNKSKAFDSATQPQKPH